MKIISIKTLTIASTAVFLSVALSLTPLHSSVAHAALTDNLVGYWNLDETSGSRTDNSGGGNTLTEQGGAVPSATGVIGNAASFGGTSSLTIADNDALSAGDIDFTVAGWVYLTSKSGDKGIVSKYTSGTNNREYSLYYRASQDSFALVVTGNGVVSNVVIASNAGSPALNTWYYVVGWHDAAGNTLNIQVNDGAVNSVSHTAGIFSGAAPFFLGNHNGSMLNGSLDNVGIWKRVLTIPERTSLYNNGNGRAIFNGANGPQFTVPPSAPLTLRASLSGSDVALTWTAPLETSGSDITDYVVEYKKTSASSWTTFADGTGTATSATVTGLDGATSYDFRVSAINGYGTGTTSITATIGTVGLFSMFDDFNTNTIDPTKWSETDGNANNGEGNVTISGGRVSIVGQSSWSSDYLSALYDFDRTAGDITVQADVILPTCGNGAIAFGPASTDALQNGTILFNIGSNYPQIFSYPTVVPASSASCAPNVPLNVRMVIRSAGGVDLYIDGATSPTASLNAAQAPASFNNFPITLRGRSATSTIIMFDNVSITGSYVTTPKAATARALPASLLAQWNSVGGASDYIVEYKPSADTAWAVFNDGVSTKRGAVITGLANGTGYDVRVSAVVRGVTGAPSPVATATPSASAASLDFYNHILSTGQSLSNGETGHPSLTTTDEYGNKMLGNDPLVLIPLVETDNKESMSSSLGNTLSSLVAPTTYDSIITKHGINGTAYSGLRKGTRSFSNGMAQVRDAFDAAVAANRPYRVAAVTVVHGEADTGDGTTAEQYEQYLQQWQSDYQANVQAITGQTGTIPMFMDQVATFTSAVYGSHAPTVTLGQLNAARDNPGKIYLVTPKYIFDYNDQAHLTNYSYRRLGEYYAKVMKKVLIDGQDWKPLMPITIKRDKNVVYADFHVPSGALAFDTTRVLEKANYGFEYYDDAASATISSVELADSDTVKITLSDTPTGGNQRLRYAYSGGVTTNDAGSRPGRTQAPSARGNLRDSDPAEARYTNSVPASFGTALYNWSVTFDEPIEVPQPIVPVPSGGGGGVSGGGGAPSQAVTPTAPATPADCRVGDSFSAATGKPCTAPAAPTVPSTPATATVAFSQTLSVGMNHSEVKALQSYLNAHGAPVAATGAGSPGKETTYFGPATKAALAKFQAANKISPASGLFGPLTRAFINGTAAADTVTVTAILLNVRTAPISGTILGKVTRGAKGIVIERKEGWSKVKFDSVEGWVIDSYIQ